MQAALLKQVCRQILRLSHLSFRNDISREHHLKAITVQAFCLATSKQPLPTPPLLQTDRRHFVLLL
jgi:hypothetical protein